MMRTNRGKLPAARCAQTFNYSIWAPKSFRANNDFAFNLTIHDAKYEFDEAVLLQVSIEDKDNKARFNIQRHVAMNPNVTEVVSIPVGDVPVNRRYKFVVKGIAGTNMAHEADLHLQTKRHIIFIQTDRAIYKPNDCIKFRVLVLDWELKPAPIKNDELNIDIIVRFFFDSIILNWLFMTSCH